MDLEKLLKDNNIKKSEMASHFNVKWATINNWCKTPERLTLERVNEITDFILSVGKKEKKKI